MKIIVRKLYNSLVPVDEIGLEKMEALKFNDEVMIEIKRCRNLSFHKKFFAFLKTTFDMQDHFTEQEAYRRWITMKSGYFTTVVCPNGNTMFLPDSISFSNMSQDDFEKLYSAVIDVFLRELGAGISENELREVLRY